MIKTILSPVTAEYVEKKSKFIANLSPVDGEEDAMRFIESIRAANRDATHNVFAYILKDGGKRCSDDGEPSGTSGVPSLQVLEGAGLCDAAVVTTRYFGGILLGTGGLVRAYSHAVRLALMKAEVKTLREARKIRFTCDYSHYTVIQRATEKHEGMITDSKFTEKVALTVCIPDTEVPIYIKELTELTLGAVNTIVDDEIIYV